MLLSVKTAATGGVVVGAFVGAVLDSAAQQTGINWNIGLPILTSAIVSLVGLVLTYKLNKLKVIADDTKTAAEATHVTATKIEETGALTHDAVNSTAAVLEKAATRDKETVLQLTEKVATLAAENAGCKAANASLQERITALAARLPTSST